MIRLRTWRYAAVCLLSAASIQAADSSLAGYLPPASSVVLGIRARNLFDGLAAQGPAMDVRASLAGMTANTPFAGFDPTKDLDEVLIATTAQGQNAPSLIVMSGRFKLPEVAAKGEKYGNAVVVGGRNGQVEAFIGSEIMLTGDAATVKAAIDRGAKASHLDPALAARIAALHGKYDFWGTGTIPAGVKMPQGSPEQLAAIDRFEFGMTLNKGLDCFADLHARTPQELEKLASTFRLVDAMMKAQPADKNQGSFDLKIDHSSIRATLSVPEEALKKAMAQQSTALSAMMAAQMGAGAGAWKSTAAPQAAAPAPKPAMVHGNLPPAGKAEVTRNASGDVVSVRLP
jgi:hypothetical protein